MKVLREPISGVELRRLRRHRLGALRDLPLPRNNFSIAALVANIELARGRSIRLVQVDDSASDLRMACGLRVRGRASTYILYRRRPTPNQTEHTLLHELAHEWLDHRTNLPVEALASRVPEEDWRRIVADVGPDAVVQARARFGSVEEQEAELSASLIKSMVRRRSAWGEDPVSLLESSLSHPVAAPRNAWSEAARGPRC